MSGLTLVGALGLGLALLVLHMISTALAKASRTYSRSRLEDLCTRRGHPKRADLIAHHDDRTERAVEGLAVLTGLALAAMLGAIADRVASQLSAEAAVLIALAVGGAGHVVAGVIGRVHAETVLDRLWPLSVVLRRLMSPLIFLARRIELLVYYRSRRFPIAPRPASVEVEIHSTPTSEDDDIEADLPESARDMIERVVELTRMDVSEVMTTRSAIVNLPASISARDAARAFVDSGLSRIPLYGVNRDDVVGILYAKDLFAQVLNDGGLDTASPRKLARPAMFVPEIKNAYELLGELRTHCVQTAIVLDEYGGVTGLVTLEDLLEEVVGPINDEHDQPAGADPLAPLGDFRFEADAALTLEELNDRLDLHLPTNGDFLTLGGLAFNALGRVPEPGATFRHDRIEFTVLEVGEHSIRRLLLDLQPTDEPVSEHSPG